jgi:ABC-type transporter Mla subunit MlaD
MEELAEILFPYFYYKETGLITSIWVGLLHGAFFAFFAYIIIKIQFIKKSIRAVMEEFAEDRISSNKYLKDSWILYLQHFVTLGDNTKKTDDFAESYFNQTLVQKQINVEFWKSIPGMFVGLGILGTFVGLTLGISDFNFSSSDKILVSIETLIGGIKTAFLTSLHGISLSIIFGCSEKILFNTFGNHIQGICSLLNDKYKLTKENKIQIAQQERNALFQRWESSANKFRLEMQQALVDEFKIQRVEIQKHISDELKNFTIDIQKLFVVKDEDGNDILPSNLFRDLLRESEEQSKALKSFSTDLADVIMDKLETMSVRSILPEFEKILNSLKTLETSIKSFSSSTGQDIGNQLSKAVSSLENNLKAVIEDFREAFSSGAMQQLNRVIESLNESAGVMEKLPDILGKMLDDINQTNHEESQKRQTQTKEEFDNAINKFKTSIDSIIGSLSKAEQQQINREQSILDQVNESLSSSVKQIEDMILLQETYTKEISELLSSTTNVVKDEQALLSHINENNKLMVEITNKFDMISARLNDSTNQMDNASKNLNSSLQSIKHMFQKMTEFNDKTLDQIGDSLSENQEVLNDYVRKFEIIRNGLGDIFTEVEGGLTRYSVTVKNGINDYLSEFTNKLSKASGELGGSVEALNELFEIISDQLDNIHR